MLLQKGKGKYLNVSRSSTTGPFLRHASTSAPEICCITPAFLTCSRDTYKIKEMCIVLSSSV